MCYLSLPVYACLCLDLYVLMHDGDLPVGGGVEEAWHLGSAGARHEESAGLRMP